MSRKLDWKAFALVMVVVTSLLSKAPVLALTGPNIASNPVTLGDLKSRAFGNQVNILVYDQDGRISQEFHSDGMEVTYEYINGKMASSRDSRGNVDHYKVKGDRIEVTREVNGKMVKVQNMARRDPTWTPLTPEQEEKTVREKLAASSMAQSSTTLLATTVSPMSTTEYEDYFVNGVLMNDIAPSGPNYSYDQFVHQPGNLTNVGIHSFFVGQNSILKNSVEVWKKNSGGTLYDTGIAYDPAVLINNAAVSHNMNPKVVIATLQKESQLVSTAPGTLAYSDRRFYYAMGYGATDGGDLSGTSGFDIQIDLGTKLLRDGWVWAPGCPALQSPINNGTTVTSNGVTYKSYIWSKNWGTWSLYNYTPWTLDTSLLPTIGGGNYLFDAVFKGYWGTNWY